jgi:hypothetical protein
VARIDVPAGPGGDPAMIWTLRPVLDLTMCIAAYLGLGRALEVLGIDSSCPIDV